MTALEKYRQQADRLKDTVEKYTEYFKQGTREKLKGKVEIIANELKVSSRTVQRMRKLYLYLRLNNIRFTQSNVIQAIDHLNSKK